MPKFEVIAETSLLMDGLNQSNYRSLEKLLKQKPADAETWTFIRGQALLIAETGNLLLLRPPRSGGATPGITTRWTCAGRGRPRPQSRRPRL